jgi:hypothetical protein
VRKTNKPGDPHHDEGQQPLEWELT